MLTIELPLYAFAVLLLLVAPAALLYRRIIRKPQQAPACECCLDQSFESESPVV